MTPERWQQIEALCQAALDRSSDERAAFLEQACAGDDDLRAEVESLLAAHDDDPAFLEEPVARVTSLSDEEAAEGQRIGPYRLVRPLGRGGMGQVYLAVRDDDAFTQHVAVKIIRRGLDTDDVLRRFRAERQILAALNHPGIARLYDGGATAQGVPYFVMEYVDGVPITDYCDTHRLSIDDRLQLFRKVCAAVHHAHQNLVVHRDLKPSNILVTPEGVPKLLDFGIAKLLNPDLSGITIAVTRTEQRLLTPEYASPEQVRGGPITTAADVYALGVLLYELLTGRRPYRLPSRVQQEVERIICEEEPTRPSTVVTQAEEIRLDDDTTQTITPEVVSRARATQVERLRRRLRGDLDTIVLMAMRKEPTRRYGSAEQLAEDVRRHLDGLPVQAQPDSLTYRARTFVRRHRWGVAAAALIAVLLVGATIVMAIQAAQIRARAAEVAAERDRAEEVSRFLKSVFAASDPAEARGDTLTAPELLARGAERAQAELADQPARQAEMLGVISEVYHNLGRYEQAEALARQALDLRRQVFGQTHPEVAESLNLLGQVLHERGIIEEAESLLREALVMRKSLFGREDTLVAQSLNNLALLLHDKRELDAADSLLQETLSIQRRLLGDEHPNVATSLNNRGRVLREKGDYEAAEPLYREALALRRRILGNEHPQVAASLNNLAMMTFWKGDYEAAEPLMREAIALDRKLLGDEHPEVARGLDNLGGILFKMGDYEKAEQHLRQGLALWRTLVGDEHPDVAASLTGLGDIVRAQGKYTEAEQLQREALAIRRKVYGDGHPRLALNLLRIAEAQHSQGELEGAASHYREALRLVQGTLPAHHAFVIRSNTGLGRLLIEWGKPEEAEPFLLKSSNGASRQFGDSDARTAEARAALGICLAAQGRGDEARRLLTESLPVLEEQPVTDTHLIQQVRGALASL